MLPPTCATTPTAVAATSLAGVIVEVIQLWIFSNACVPGLGEGDVTLPGCDWWVGEELGRDGRVGESWDVLDASCMPDWVGPTNKQTIILYCFEFYLDIWR